MKLGPARLVRRLIGRPRSERRPAAPARAQRAFVGGFPRAEAARRALDEADYERAMVAYRFWYPTVSAEGLFQGMREAGAGDNETACLLSSGPRHIGFTANSDTPYGLALLDLRDGPMAVEVPPGLFIGVANDHHQRWIADMGLPGPDAGAGGLHVLLPPAFEGEVPDGFHCSLSPTHKVLLTVRGLPAYGDVERAQDRLKAIKIFPLSTAASPKTMGYLDVTRRGMDATCLRWEDNFEFWRVLHEVLGDEPFVEEFRPMYALLSSVGVVRGQAFAPEARLRRILERAARDGRDQLLVSAFASERADRLAWTDRRWEWAGLVAQNGDFETPAGQDLEARERWFAHAVLTSPAMMSREAGSSGSLYWIGVRDKTGAYLDGGKSYRLIVPEPVPARLFWSVTVYDAQTRSQIQTTQDKAALRSLFELRDVSRSRPTELRFGPKPPRDGEERWIKTLPGRGWFAYFRIYGPESEAFDGRWRLDDFEPTQT